MGAAATGSVSVNTARKVGKRYSWGAERPGVIEKRVQMRKNLIDAEIVKIREEGEREIARRVAAKEAEKTKLAEQEVLVAEHRQALKEGRRSFRKGDFTDEQRAAIKAQYPGIDDEEADFLLSRRARQSVQIPVSEIVTSQELAAAVSPASNETTSANDQTVKPLEAPKAVASEKPKPAPILIEASVNFSTGPSDLQRNGPTEPDWADFDPEAWEEGQDYPEDQYREKLDRDGYRFLVPRHELEEVEPEATPEIQALRDRRREIGDAHDRLFDRFGRHQMLWSVEAIAEAERLSQEATEVDIRMCALLAAL